MDRTDPYFVLLRRESSSAPRPGYGVANVSEMPSARPSMP